METWEVMFTAWWSKNGRPEWDNTMAKAAYKAGWDANIILVHQECPVDLYITEMSSK